MKMFSVVLMSLFAASVSPAQNSIPDRMILNCDTADLSAEPYTHFQITTQSGRLSEMKYMVFPFHGAEIFPFVQTEESLAYTNSDKGSSLPETKQIAGGFYFSWGDGDAAHMKVKRAKTVIAGKTVKSKNFVGNIYFPNGNGPEHLHDGGSVKVSCTLATSAWRK